MRDIQNVVSGLALWLVLQVFVSGGMVCLERFQRSSRLEIVLRSPQKSALQVFAHDRTRNWTVQYAQAGAWQALSLDIPNDIDVNDLRLDFGNRPQSYEIASISIVKWALIRQKLDMSHANKVYPWRHQVADFAFWNSVLSFQTTGDDGHLVPDPAVFKSKLCFSLANYKMLSWGAVLEILILCICVSGSIRRWISRVSSFERIRWWDLSCATLLMASIFGLFIPLTASHAAASVLPFDRMLVFRYCIPLTAWFFVMATLVFSLVTRRFGALFLVIAVMVTGLVVLENGFLAIGLPELDGNLYAWWQPFRMWAHATFWVIGICAALFLQRAFVRWLRVVLMVIAVLAVAAALDSVVQVGRPSVSAGGSLKRPRIVNETVPLRGTLEHVRFSRKDNVIMICLDSITAEAFQTVLEESPEYRDEFSGFVFFPNNIGMAPYTMYAVPGFFTGMYMEANERASDYTASIYSSRSLLKRFIDDSYAIYSRVGLPKMSYVFPGKVTSEVAGINTPFLDGSCPFRFYEFCLFKAIPYFLKFGYLRYLNTHTWTKSQTMDLTDLDMRTRESNEDAVYGSIGVAPMIEGAFEGTFHYHHFQGTHQPLNLDANGRTVCRSVPYVSDWDGFLDRTRLEAKRLVRLFRVLKERGLYDVSTIVVLADHGAEPHRKETPIPSRMMPMLMVKGRKCTGALVVDPTPTSHAKIADLLRSDLTNMTQADVAKALRSEKRIFQWMDKRGGYDLYEIGTDLTFVKRHYEAKSIDELTVLKPNCRYLLRSIGNDAPPDVAYENCERVMQGYQLVANEVARLKVRAPSPGAQYKIRLGVWYYGSEGDLVMLNCGGCPDVSYVLNARTADDIVVLPNCRADSSGILTVSARMARGSFNFWLTSIELQAVE